jgi:hypothetical protein
MLFAPAIASPDRRQDEVAACSRRFYTRLHVVIPLFSLHVGISRVKSVRYALQKGVIFCMKTRGLRSNSRPHRFASIDRRTAEGRLFEQFRTELVAHVGGTPNIVQSAMIERCVSRGDLDEKAHCLAWNDPGS